MKSIAFACLLLTASCIHFNTTVPGEYVQCFFEQLNYKTKIGFEVTPMHVGRVTLTMALLHNQEREKDTNIYEKLLNDENTVRVNKYAPATGTYAICLNNHLTVPLRVGFKLQKGLELMETDALPSQDDKAYLDQELAALEQSHMSLLESLKYEDAVKTNTQELTNLMTTKTLWFGIAGLAVVILANVCFQREVRKTLKQRKLI